MKTLAILPDLSPYRPRRTQDDAHQTPQVERYARASAAHSGRKLFEPSDALVRLTYPGAEDASDRIKLAQRPERISRRD